MMQKNSANPDWVSFRSLKHAYENTFSSPDGQRVLRHLIDQGHFLQSTHAENGLMSLYEGERNFLLKIAGMIPGLFGEVLADHLGNKESQLEVTLAKQLVNQGFREE